MIPSGFKAKKNTGTQYRSRSAASWLLWPALLFAFALVLLISSIPLTLEQQLLFVLASLGLSLLLRPRDDRGRYRIIVLISISIIATSRYIYWRLTDSLGWFNTNIELSALDYFFSFGLLAAELYAWTVLFLGYFQTIWPLRRPSFPLPNNKALWPSVDILIPTYNEPLKVVAPSFLAAANLDWPKDRLNVYLLDDGCRDEFKQFAEDAGLHYIDRKSSEGAKAGNINHALERTTGDFVAIFDCDHVPVRSFLRKTMGWFLRDRKLGIVQTPHLFFTPDPVERNLQIFHRVPPEGQLFYGLVQDGNDTWNASFFCGSCAVIKRKALDEIGGIATDTVTEDAHTSLLIQKNGWNTAYLNEPLAAGLATEQLSHHIGQRMRWARGMIQVFRTDNPIFAKGLSLGQRLCYFNAMLHFLFGLPRLIFLTAPLAYLFFESYVIQASAALIAVFALPHIFQAQVANSVMQGRYRHSFWADVYETLISAHLLAPTLGALLNPSKGHFNVTNKGGVVNKDHFDWSSSKVVFFLLLLNLIGLFIAFVRLFWLNPEETGTVLINLGWTIYNSIILGAALSVAWEKRQRRDNPRIRRSYPALVHLANGKFFRAQSIDISTKDISLKIPPNAMIDRDENLEIELFDGENGYKFPGQAKTIQNRHLGVLFDDFSPRKLSDLVYFTHARENAWDEWYHIWLPSKPLASFFEIVRFGILGVFKALSDHSDDPENRVKADYSTAGWLAFVLFLVVGSYLAPTISRADTVPTAATETFQKNLQLTFEELGIKQPLKLRGGNTQDSIWFSLRADQIAKQAELQLSYSIAKQLIKDYKSLDISLNHQPIGSIPITADTVETEHVRIFPIDPLYISDLNELGFRLIPIESDFCEKLNYRAVTAEIKPNSNIRMTVHPLDLNNDLANFPIPFFDKYDDNSVVLPIIFSSRLIHSLPALKASGILASWFGGKADYRGAEFPALINQVPDRHAILMVTPDNQPDFIPPLQINGPGIEIVSLPAPSEHIKLLAIKGRTDEELVAAASILVSGERTFEGTSSDFDEFTLPRKRKAYDAPRWLNDGSKTYFTELAPPNGFINYGTAPHKIDLNFRIAPDLYYWRQDELEIHTGYQYSDLPLKEDSSLDVSLGKTWLKSLKIETTDELPKTVANQTETPSINQIKDTGSIYIKNYQLAGLNRLSFYFDLQPPDEAAQTCASLYTENMKSGIDPDSHFDLTGWTHFSRMPDNAKFANIGYPYTRYADLSETSIILPDSPTTGEVSMMLNTLGHFGSATGYPAFRISLAFPGHVAEAEDHDIIIIGSNERQPLLKEWHNHLSLQLTDSNSWEIRAFNIWEKIQLWWKGEKSERIEDAQRMLQDIGNNLIALTSFQSPFVDDKTVTLMLAGNDSGYAQIGRALRSPDMVSRFKGDLTLLNQDVINSFRLWPSYHIGELPWLTWVRWYLSHHIMALLLLFTFVVFGMALVLRIMLKRTAESRFDFEPQSDSHNLR